MRVGRGGDQPELPAGGRLHHPHARQRAGASGVTPPGLAAASPAWSGRASSAIADEVRARANQICNLGVYGNFDPREFPIPRLLLERIEEPALRTHRGGSRRSGSSRGRYARELGLAIPASSMRDHRRLPGPPCSPRISSRSSQAIESCSRYRMDGLLRAGRPPPLRRWQRHRPFLPTAAVLAPPSGRATPGAQFPRSTPPARHLGPCATRSWRRSSRRRSKPPHYLLYDQVLDAHLRRARARHDTAGALP